MSFEPGTSPAQPPAPSRESAAPSFASRIHGCLLGGAIGDALGSAVEFDDIDAILARFGPSGLRDFSPLDGGSHVADDTQLTLYTADGLLEALEWANDGVAADINACVWLAYLRWLATQGVAVPPSAPVQPPRWIDSHAALKHRRSPDEACLSGLATGEMGTVLRPVNQDLNGSSTVARSAPFGLIPHIEPATVYKLSADAAALTHGHPAARQGAGIFSLLIHAVTAGLALREAAEFALRHLREEPLQRGEAPDAALIGQLEAALRLSGPADERDTMPETGPTLLGPEDMVRELGEGRTAEQALAIAVYAVLATAPAEPTTGAAEPTTAPGAAEAHVRSALAVAVNHSGGSDTTASIAGSILGAFYGEEGLPAQWLEALDAVDVIRGLAGKLTAVTGA
ncbi:MULTISPECIES: ADP-ribosylglycohydrolase family protein [Arthrobacter]|uniref:ADP-ribosylglycohydrolase family protein n=1 Tax=Arthrobacter oryzae TaxID=409290 RepID=A0A3N0C666_9MICC|nr:MULTISPECIES: ADP-ribosylglycohydrolase family protein [Arthrobacter]QYF89814.1 ADP-ribosylglycohydrolase family protein [Arthrobacter sp. PAMC25284]RNL58566.1 ADP-ribosylglycohydrolase family protein [Arthrobacter oryzae]